MIKLSNVEKRIIFFSGLFLFSIFFLIFPEPAFSEEAPLAVLPKSDELEEELKYLQEETYVITPSKIPQRIEKAPGSIYVVTDKMIRQMGARYLSEVIQTVPGWCLEPYYGGGDIIYADGGSGEQSSFILFMVNSLIVNSPMFGSGAFYQWLDLDNVKRIEFVTGPGSALYGSGAVAGIVNIITKEGEDVDGLQLTGRGGSYHTWEGNTLFGKKIEGFEFAGYMGYMDTDGFRGHVDRDYQSVLDQLTGTHSSLAPGNMRGAADQWDGQLTMKYRGFKFDGKYLGRDREAPFGSLPILDDRSDYDQHQYYLNLGYDTKLAEGLDFTAKLYRNEYTNSNTVQLRGEGSRVSTPTGPTILTQDMYYEFTGKERRTGGEAQSTYEILDNNIVVGGISFEQMEIYDNTTKATYLPTPYWGVNIPLNSLQVWPDSLQLPNEKRNLWAAYVEDIWDILDDLRLTIGGRYDHYSDVGGQFNPRIGINWDFAEHWYAKFLYGRSFRAPTFYEMYSPNSGNPDLKPMSRENYQLSLGIRFLPALTAQVTGYYYKPKDVINRVLIENSGQYKYINYGDVKIKGFELQMKYDFGRGTYLSMNYSYIDLDMWDNNQQYVAAWWQARQLGTLSANVRLNKYLNLNSYLLYRGDWTRADGDTRDDPGDYAIVNATLIAKNFVKELEGLEVRAAVRNLFDKDYTAPATPGLLPDDIPMPGINFFLELRYTF